MSEENTLPLPDVISELRALEARKAELEALASEAKKTNLPLVVEGIKTYIYDNGFTLNEVLPLLAGKAKKASKPRATRNEGPRVTFTSKTNPGNVYVRGVLPAWLKTDMLAAGFDPENKESRDKYKAEHMISSATPVTAEA
jgi:DNA-binding protein H-NS